MLKQALCICSMATLPLLGTLYADSSEDIAEPIEQSMSYYDVQEEEIFVDADEDPQDSLACSCRERDKKDQVFQSDNEEESVLACTTDEEGGETPSSDEEQTSSLC